MGIPIGSTYTSTVRGSMLKELGCENCAATFTYEAEREFTGSGTSFLWLDNYGAQDRARRKAHRGLHRELANAVDPVACPACGWFQANMCKMFKQRQARATWKLSFLMIVIGLLVWGMMTINAAGSNSMRPLIIGASVCVAGIFSAVTWSLTNCLNRKHPGRGGSDPKMASGSRGIIKAEAEAAIARA